ncbi:MAG: MATE family efflux transporter, partial [Proteobacteria bacterium]|nr:MATE family efflux transporter [Burkholderiales bacterium]
MTEPLQPSRALATLLRQSVPTTLIGVAQAVALTLETVLVGRLGTEALAAYALVLPLALLMNMMSTGAMGGGVSSAVARTLGSGRREQASALIVHALLIGGGLGLLFTVLVETLGHVLFFAMGARGTVLEQATAYARVLFIGVPF